MIQIDFNDLPQSIKDARRVNNDEIRESGKTYSAFALRKDDVIEFDSKEVYVIDQPFKSRGKEQPCLKFVASVNSKITAVPCGTLMKMPFRQMETWLEAHEVNRELYNAGDNLSRLELCKGRKLRVKDMEKGPRATFNDDGTLKVDDKGEPITREGLFPVFEWA